MFKCEKCKTLEESLAFERQRNISLIDRLMALANPGALQAVRYDPLASNPDDYYGGQNDLIESRNEFGEKILIKMNPHKSQV